MTPPQMGGRRASQVQILTREMAQANANELLALSADMPWETWTTENLLRELPEKWQRSRAIFDSDSPIAYAIISRKADSVHVHHLMVRPTHRGLGFGELLLNDAIGQARQAKLALTLKAHETNASAIAFYLRHGFARGGRQPNGYINLARGAEDCG